MAFYKLDHYFVFLNCDVVSGTIITFNIHLPDQFLDSYSRLWWVPRRSELLWIVAACRHVMDILQTEYLSCPTKHWSV